MTDRERFEAWYCADAKAQGCSLPDGIADLRDGDGYGSHRVMLNGKWQGWQASRKQALEEAKAACFVLTAGESDNDTYWYDSGVEDCMDSVARLANPEGEQG